MDVVKLPSRKVSEAPSLVGWQDPCHWAPLAGANSQWPMGTVLLSRLSAQYTMLCGQTHQLMTPLF